MSLLLNICKYAECGLIFPNLNQLIEHIEKQHMNFDPEFLECLENEKPKMMPMSYVLPYNRLNKTQYENENITNQGSEAKIQKQNIESVLDTIIESSSESNNSTNSNDMKHDPVREFNFKFIMRYGSIPTTNETEEKPFACPIPGCKKRYKNINGLKYHARNGHTKRGKVAKKFECICGKAYKTAQGLRAHVVTVKNCGEFILPSSCLLPQSKETISLLTLTNLPNDFERFYDITENTEDGMKSDLHPMSLEEKILAADFNVDDFEIGSDSFSLDDQSYNELTALNETESKVDLMCIKIEKLDEEINVGDSSDCFYP